MTLCHPQQVPLATTPSICANLRRPPLQPRRPGTTSELESRWSRGKSAQRRMSNGCHRRWNKGLPGGSAGL
eukprot:10349425-Prorocentrum_lima.AAC.1